MPCDSGGYSHGDDYQARSSVADLKKEVDELTRMLCSLLRAYEGMPITEEVAEWYRKHREWDKSQGRP